MGNSTRRPAYLFALPDQSAAANHWSVDIFHLGSLILTHSWNGEVRGLKEVPAQDRPYVPILFFALRAMIGIGMVLLSVSILGAYERWRGHLFTDKWFLTALVLVSPLGFLGTIAGWIVTEAGRSHTLYMASSGRAMPHLTSWRRMWASLLYSSL